VFLKTSPHATKVPGEAGRRRVVDAVLLSPRTPHPRQHLPTLLEAYGPLSSGAVHAVLFANREAFVLSAWSSRRPVRSPTLCHYTVELRQRERVRRSASPVSVASTSAPSSVLGGVAIKSTPELESEIVRLHYASLAVPGPSRRTSMPFTKPTRAWDRRTTAASSCVRASSTRLRPFMRLAASAVPEAARHAVVTRHRGGPAGGAFGRPRSPRVR